MCLRISICHWWCFYCCCRYDSASFGITMVVVASVTVNVEGGEGDNVVSQYCCCCKYRNWQKNFRINFIEFKIRTHLLQYKMCSINIVHDKVITNCKDILKHISRSLSLSPFHSAKTLFIIYYLEVYPHPQSCCILYYANTLYFIKCMQPARVHQFPSSFIRCIGCAIYSLRIQLNALWKTWRIEWGCHVKLLMEINLSNSSVYLNIPERKEARKRNERTMQSARCSFIHSLIRYTSMQFQFLLIKTVLIRFLFDDIQQMCNENTRTHRERHEYTFYYAACCEQRAE